MAIMERMKRLFSGKKRLEKIPIDDLRKERIRLEQAEQRVGKEIDDLEKRKQQLFVKGKDEASQRQQIALARKIKELDAAAQIKDRQLAMVSRQMRILGGLIMLKENNELVRDLGVSSIIQRMDLDELQAYIERATVEGQFQMERFAQILKTLESPEGVMAGSEEEADTLAIVAAMQEAKAAESGSPDGALETGLKRIDEILHAKDSEASEDAVV